MSKLLKKSFLTLGLFLCFFCFCGFREDDDKKYVYDNAELILENDEDNLEEECRRASEEYEIDFVIVTTNNTNTLSSRNYAENFILEKDLGYEKDGRVDKSIVLFLIDLDNKETYIATSGFGILCIEDQDIERILDQIYLYISSDYYSACIAFVDTTENVIEENMDEYASGFKDAWDDWDGNYEEFCNVNLQEKGEHYDTFRRLDDPFTCLLISLVIGLVSVSVMAFSNRAKMTVDGLTYMDRNEMRVNVHTDRYVRTVTTKTKIDDSSSSGGYRSSGGHSHSHGGSHHSSGGRSFGGGGRKL